MNSYFYAFVCLQTPDGNDADLLTFLAEPGMDLNDETYGKTLLHWAAGNGRKGAVDALLAAGADVNAADASGQTPLHLAIQAGHQAVVEALLKVPGIDVNVKRREGLEDGGTALHIAAQNGYVGVVTALLKAGANPFVKNNNEKTCFDLEGKAAEDEKLKKMMLEERAWTARGALVMCRARYSQLQDQAEARPASALTLGASLGAAGQTASPALE